MTDFSIVPSENSSYLIKQKSEINFYAFDFRFVVPH